MDSPETDAVQDLLLEQRHQITQARTLDADLHFAFNLQMQEALSASLSLNDSVLVKTPNEDEALFLGTENENDDLYAFLLQDMERVEQEMEDHETCKQLMREYEEDLDRRIYDQKFANEIMSIPDQQWHHDGDYYNKPYVVAAPKLRLARAAIVPQITYDEGTSDGKNALKETCVICIEDKTANQMFSVEHCLHRFCFDCMKRHVEEKLLNGWEPKCPQEGCESDIRIETCGNFVDPRIFDVMVVRKKESSIAMTERVYCPVQTCSALMSKTEVLEYTKASSFVGAENCGARKCVKCQRFFCINCQVPWHHNLSCDYYRSLYPYPKAEDCLLNTLATEKRWRQCVKCKHMVELAEGCYHIYCRCGYEFCYTCGAEWIKKSPTCNCPIWDERNIIRDG